MSESLLVALLILLFLLNFKTENKLNVLILLPFKTRHRKLYMLASLLTL